MPDGPMFPGSICIEGGAVNTGVPGNNIWLDHEHMAACVGQKPLFVMDHNRSVSAIAGTAQVLAAERYDVTIPLKRPKNGKLPDKGDQPGRQPGQQGGMGPWPTGRMPNGSDKPSEGGVPGQPNGPGGGKPGGGDPPLHKVEKAARMTFRATLSQDFPGYEPTAKSILALQAAGLVPNVSIRFTGTKLDYEESTDRLMLRGPYTIPHIGHVDEGAHKPHQGVGVFKVTQQAGVPGSAYAQGTGQAFQFSADHARLDVRAPVTEFHLANAQELAAEFIAEHGDRLDLIERLGIALGFDGEDADLADSEELKLGEDGEFPFSGAHNCKLTERKSGATFRSKKAEIAGKPVTQVFQIVGGKSELHGVRFPTSSWSADQAKAHCKGTFEPAKEGSHTGSAALYEAEGMVDPKPITAQRAAEGDNEVTPMANSDTATPPAGAGGAGSGGAPPAGAQATLSLAQVQELVSKAKADAKAESLAEFQRLLAAEKETAAKTELQQFRDRLAETYGVEPTELADYTTVGQLQKVEKLLKASPAQGLNLGDAKREEKLPNSFALADEFHARAFGQGAVVLGNGQGLALAASEAAKAAAATGRSS